MGLVRLQGKNINLNTYWDPFQQSREQNQYYQPSGTVKAGGLGLQYRLQYGKLPQSKEENNKSNNKHFHPLSDRYET
jgi:hypothetical protein